MKKDYQVKCFTSFLLTCFSAFTLQAQLKWLNPRPAGYACNKIIFTDANNGFVFNSDGNLIKTTNQGVTWKVANRFGGMQYFDILDSTAIVAGGWGIIYISNDNGTTWQKIFTGINAGITGIDIVSRDTIFLSGSNNIYKSYNRGQTWQIITLTNTIVSSFDFINSQLGFVGKTSRSILKTTDGGQTWQETAIVNTSPSAIRCIKFLNADTGYAFREHSYLLKTTNSGQSWSETNISDYIFTMSFPTGSVGYIAGEYGAIYRTSNAGANWNWAGPATRYYGYNINSIYFVTADTGFATGLMGRILKTVDGGTTWQPYSLIYTDISDFAFPDAATGYVVSGNAVYKTTDSAKSWIALPLSPGNGYNSIFDKVYFFSKDTGFVTSTNYAHVNKTNDGGQTWKKINPSGYYGYDRTGGISFVNDSTGFISIIISYGYLLAKTKNRGETWQGIDSSHYMGEIYSGIHFVDEKTGFGLRYGKLYKTNDSAKTWTLLLDNGNTDLQGLWFFDEGTGLVGDGNGLKRTTDSGRTWVSIPFTYFDREIGTLKFLNKNIGYVTCLSGAIYQSADGGATWVYYGKTPYACRNITFNKDSVVYFGGMYGSILSANTGYVLSSDYKCSGRDISFVSDITGTSYLWQVDSNDGLGFVTISNNFFYSGANTNTLKISYSFTAWQGFKYRCVVNGVSNSRIFELKFRTHWTGALDNYWDNPGNWSCGAVPDTNSDVLIGSSSVVLRSNAAVRSLKIIAGASLTIDPGYQLTIVQ